MLRIHSKVRGKRARWLRARGAGLICALTLAAGLASSAAPAAHAGTLNYEVAYRESTGFLVFAISNFGQEALGPVAAGTNPSVTPLGDPLAPSSMAWAWVNASGDVNVASVLTRNPVDVGPAAARTSPSLVGLTNGGWEVAFQQPNGNVVAVSSSGVVTSWGLAEPATSPGLASLPNATFEVAYHASFGELVTEGADLHGAWNLGLAAGTSPAITGLANGHYEVAFQAAGTGSLWTVGSDNHGAWNLGMRAGTSPSITIYPTGTSYEVAFQANTGSLWTVGSDNHGAWPAGPMAADASPSIAP